MTLPEPIGQAALAFFQKLLGPVGEAGEFLTDKIRFYRWQSSLRTLKRAREIALEHKLTINEVPLKFLIPFMEKSSLEEDSDELIERWAQLLAGASENKDNAKTIFIDVLSVLSSADVKTLEEFLPRSWYDTLEQKKIEYAEFLPAEYSEAEFLTTVAASNRDQLTRDAIDVAKNIIKSGQRGHSGFQYAESEFDKLVKTVAGGSEYESIAFNAEGLTNEDGDQSVYVTNPRVYRKLASYEVLIARGLIGRQAFHLLLQEANVNVVILSPTPLGYSFVRACRGPSG